MLKGIGTLCGVGLGKVFKYEQPVLDIKEEKGGSEEEIVDTGRTYEKVQQLLYAKGATSVKIVSLLDKKEKREVDVVVDYIGFEIPNEFVIGFGLDYNEKYRNLPYIGVIKKSAIVWKEIENEK